MKEETASTNTIETLSRELSELAPDTPNAERIALHQLIAEGYAEQSKFPFAAPELERAIELALADNKDNAERHELLGNLYFQLALYQSRSLETEKAEETAQKAIDAYTAANAETHYAKAYRRLGAIQFENDKFEQAHDNLHLALQWAEKMDNNAIRAGAYLTLAEMLSLQQQHTDALTCYQNAAALFDIQENYTDAGTALQGCARIWIQYGKHAEALKCYEQADKGYLQNPNLNEERAVNQMLIARLHEAKDRLDPAVTHFLVAAQCFEQANNPYETANCHIHIGVLYKDHKQWDNSLKAYQNALSAAQQADDEILLASAEDGIEHAKEQLQKKTTQPEKSSLFGKIKKTLFG